MGNILSYRNINKRTQKPPVNNHIYNIGGHIVFCNSKWQKDKQIRDKISLCNIYVTCVHIKLTLWDIKQALKFKLMDIIITVIQHLYGFVPQMVVSPHNSK